MSETKPADLTLAIQKATEGFTAIIDRPTDNDIINIRQLRLPVLMTTKYDELTLTHNLSEVILPTKRYEEVYPNRVYEIPSVIAIYDDAIETNATRTEFHRAKGKHEAKINDRALYEMADKECKNFIMKVVDETWYKELEYPDTFYTNVTALKLVEHLTEFCSGLHTVDAVDIPQVMKTLFSDTEGIPQYINAMKAAQRKSKRVKLVITEEYMHSVALKLLLHSKDGGIV